MFILSPMMVTTNDISLTIDPELSGIVRVALVWARGLPGCPGAGAVSPYLAELLTRIRATGESFLPPGRKAAVRSMLRHGKYRPSGRSKPSSEYLLASALEGDGPLGGFPLVNGPVDANNAVSLEWGYPASIFDIASTGRDLLIRRGLPGESYVFNPSGQVIELEDLIVVCRRTAGDSWEPCGNPVKDAMATKVFAGCRDVAAIVYAPAVEAPDLLKACAERFTGLLMECGASDTDFRICGD